MVLRQHLTGENGKNNAEKREHDNQKILFTTKYLGVHSV